MSPSKRKGAYILVPLNESPAQQPGFFLPTGQLPSALLMSANGT